MSGAKKCADFSRVRFLHCHKCLKVAFHHSSGFVQGLLAHNCDDRALDVGDLEAIFLKALLRYKEERATVVVRHRVWPKDVVPSRVRVLAVHEERVQVRVHVTDTLGSPFLTVPNKARERGLSHFGQT